MKREDNVVGRGSCRASARRENAKRPGERRPSAALGASGVAFAFLCGVLLLGLRLHAADQFQLIAPLMAQANAPNAAQLARQPTIKPQGDVIEFVDGSMLHGQLRQMDADHGLAWANPNAKNPIRFQPGHIDFIRFARADTMKLAPTCHLRFANGDDLFGSITSLDSEQLGLSTWFGGTMTIPRSAIRGITFLSKNYSLLYEGPYDATGWVFGIANMPQSWNYHDGWFTSQGTGTMGRELSLTNSSTVEFDLAWSAPLEMELQLYTDALERMVRNDGSFFLQFTPNQILLGQGSSMGMQRNFGAAALPDTGGKNRMHVTIQCNETEGTVSLFINDALIRVWKDEPGFHPAGTGILFQQEGYAGGMVKIGNLRISRWEGNYDPDTTLAATNSDSIHFVNHDRAAGKIAAIKDGVVTLAMGDTTLNIPLQRVTQINFAATNEFVETPSPWQVRAHFPGGGSISFQLEKWDDTTISGKSPVFGMLAFQARAVREMEFNLNRTKDDGVAVANRDFEDLDE